MKWWIKSEITPSMLQNIQNLCIALLQFFVILPLSLLQTRTNLIHLFPRNIAYAFGIWAEKRNRKPLVLRGARQVGKTSAVLLLAERFKSFIHLNLEKETDRNLFNHSTEVTRLFDAICLYKNVLPVKGSTLLFIDEIQYSSSAVQMLRYFYEEMPWVHVIAAGSLLESLLIKGISFPVGRVEYLPVRPCSFSEYLIAFEDYQSHQLLQEIPFPDYGHEHLLQRFMLYMITGGMPEIIKTYKTEQSIALLHPVYESLMTSYLDDVEKYARNETMVKVIRHTIKHAFEAAALRITFQGFGKSNYKSREMGESFQTLQKAFLLQLMYPTNNTESPPAPNYRRSPKLQLVDTGLVNYISGYQGMMLNLEPSSTSFRGRIAEHITGQELLTLSDSVRFELKYWTREKKDASAEVDFIWSHEGKVLPVEVKSGSAGKLRSLHQFIDRAPHSLGVRIYAGKLTIEKTKTLAGKEFTLMNLPFYLIHKLPEYLSYMEKVQNGKH